jgi:tetratricopeptide (TPR) repeat protein
MWRARPVFISSTFLDMQAERDHLRTHVFPALEEKLRERRHFIEWVDLRLGVAEVDESVHELQVLKVCLAEVKRCRPFLIVLLGDRYGWIPPPDRLSTMQAAAAEEGFIGSVAGRSVTELELEFGILSDSARATRAFFFVREPLPYEAMTTDVAARYSDAYATDIGAAERARNIRELKRRIESRFPTRVVPYRASWDNERQRVIGLDAFGRIVLEHVWAELADETAEALKEVEISWQQAEGNALDDFMEDRARDFAGRKDELTHIGGLCSSPEREGTPWGACVTGVPGSGKSALLSTVYRNLKQTDALVLAHASAASAQATSIDLMLRRFVDELAAALAIPSPLPSTASSEEIEATFLSFLTRAADRCRVVVLVDALDQFEATSRARFVTWLPLRWPGNARLVATAVSGDAANALASRAGLEMMSLSPLQRNEARTLVTRICDRYHRVFDPEVIDALLAKGTASEPASGNPLWLVLAVEELNLLDEDDFARLNASYSGSPSVRLRRLMLDVVAKLPSDIVGLHDLLFARAEELFGVGFARAFLSSIAVGRGGWREADFRVLVPKIGAEPWDELRFASLRRLLRGQLRRRGVLEQWDVNHTQMRYAVLERLASWGMPESSIHAILADHLLSSPSDDPLRISETMMHLLASNDWKRAARYYGDSSRTEAEVEQATLVIADRMMIADSGSGSDALHEVQELLEAINADEDADLAFALSKRMLHELCGTVDKRGGLAILLRLLNSLRDQLRLLEVRRPDHILIRHSLAVSNSLMGDAFVKQSDLSSAVEAHRAATEIFDRLARESPTSLVEYFGSGQGEATFGSIKTVMERDFTAAQSSLADLLMEQGHVQEALDLFNRACDRFERLSTAEPENLGARRDLALAQRHVGTVHQHLGDFATAASHHRSALVTFESLISQDPNNLDWNRQLALVHAGLGHLLGCLEDLPGALENCGQAVAIFERLTRSEPENSDLQRDLFVSQSEMGLVLFGQGEFAAALDIEWCANRVIERLAKADPGNAAWQLDLALSYGHIGQIKKFQKLPDEALDVLTKGRAIILFLLERSPDNASFVGALSWLDDLIESCRLFVDRERGTVTISVKHSAQDQVFDFVRKLSGDE